MSTIVTSNLDYQEWDQRRPRHLGLSCRFVIEGLRNLRPARTYGKTLTAHRLRMGIHRMDADLTEGVHRMSAARYSAVPLILTILFACASLVRGVLHPSLNFDLIPYSALAKEVRGAGGKNETYRELAAKVGEPSFQTFVSGAYRERLYADDASFEAILPFYSIRPLYILLCSVIGLLIGSDVAATFVVSAISTALAVILSYTIAQRIGPPAGAWRLVIPISWAVSGGLYLATLSSPDALAALITLLFIHTSLGGRWVRGRLIRLMLLSALMVATRTDSLVLVMALLLCEWLFESRHRFATVLIALVALSSYFVIQRMSGNYGYLAILNFTLIDPSHFPLPDRVPHPSGYIRVLVHETIQVFGGDYESGLLLLAASLQTVACFRAWHTLRVSCCSLHRGQDS